jgi:hypothetical protein
MGASSKHKLFGFKLFKRVEVLLHDQVVIVQYIKTPFTPVLMGLLTQWCFG